MYAKQPKKMLIMDILEVLRKYSDAEHRLTQKDIAKYLERDYDMSADPFGRYAAPIISVSTIRSPQFLACA